MVNTFKQTNCGGITPRVMLASLSFRISVSPEVIPGVSGDSRFLKSTFCDTLREERELGALCGC